MKNIFIFGTLLLVPVASAHADWKNYGGNSSIYNHGGNSSIYSAQSSYSNHPRHNNYNNCDSPRPRFYNNSNYNKPNYSPYSQIRNGVRSGELSPRETRELRGDLFEIKNKENHYLADGHLSKWERESLRDDYNDFRHELKHELNDGEHRW